MVNGQQKLGLRLSQFRKSKNLSQAEFAIKLECSQPNLNKIENGNTGISSRMRHRLMTSFPELNMNWLDQGSGPMVNSISPTQFDKDLSLENSRNRKGLIETLGKMIGMFEKGEIPISVLLSLLDHVKNLVQKQEKRIHELESDKELLKSVILKFREENM